MGFLILNEVKLNKLGGLALTGLYATLQATFNVEKRLTYTDITHTTVAASTQYILSGQLFIKASASTQKWLDIVPLGINITESQLSGDLLSLLYTEAKSKYTSTTDV